jgi:hypothetical protein
MGSTSAPAWLVSGFFCAFFIGFALAIPGFSPSARIAPLAIAVPGMLLTLWQFVGDLAASRRGGATTEAASATTSRPGMLLWLTLLVSATILVGLVAGCWLFITLFMVVRTKFGIKPALATASLFSGAVYLLFTIVLGISLHIGVLLEAILS